MAFTEDFDDFFDTGEFAVVATVGISEIKGILDKEYVELLDIQGYAPVFTCKTSDISAVSDGDTYVIDSVTYHQIKKEQDGTGITRVILRAA